MDSLSDEPKRARNPTGRVYLVGAGPGDPELLTLRAHELLRAADLVLYDNLVSPEVLEHASPSALRRYVGKKRAEHACTQAEINGLMVAAARDGKVVVRLKGGDPYVFGRGGEEALGLARAGIPFEVVPGVTSALGAAAYAGMPLTHRDHTQAVTLVTGHDVDQIDWSSLAGRQTLVVFMGLTSMPAIAERLIGGGMPPETPAAAIRWVTRGDQKVVTAPIADLPVAIRREGLRPPALVVIGDIVSLRDQIDWFDNLPLRGQSVVVTRAASQAAPFCGVLRRLGARVIPISAIAFEAPSSWASADAAIEGLARYDWAIFTSVNGVDHFLERLDASVRDLRHLPKKIAAIGSATADRLRELHLKVELVPDQFVAEALAEAFLGLDMRGSRVLLPRAEEARSLLPEQLAEMGAEIDVVPVYRTVVPEASRQLAERAWSVDPVPDWVTLTSSSTARMLAQMVPLDRLKRSKLASIGPVTSATIRELGLPIAVEARRFTTDGLAEALCIAVADSLR
ncbi:MAG: uroporphyrinogen-III C-methyltransferase [Acidobacteriia bacterium]|nr:uroporphyrinogen-III C-methyltransferase [Terriglobia bacterium]MYG04025.1 uroporphyrinogen-III C-methyltransferase [Terriglobia bacterium]MYK11462.1 uroporphyrinogen-III C-methyltransferase [Terriglobia bacterium]